MMGSYNETNIPHNLLLIDKFFLNFCKNVPSYFTAGLKLSMVQISQTIQEIRFFWYTSWIINKTIFTIG